jgi:hypothetical protein
MSTVVKELLQIRPFALGVLRKFAAEGKLFAILDACDEPEVQQKVGESEPDRVKCLYRDVDDLETLAVAPYLAHLGEDDVDWVDQKLWDRFWGVFVVAESSIKTLRAHFRKFLTVELENEGAVYFRYYDPRVLETFLPTCDGEQLQKFFGPVDAYGVANRTNQNGREVMLFTRS